MPSNSSIIGIYTSSTIAWLNSGYIGGSAGSSIGWSTGCSTKASTGAFRSTCRGWGWLGSSASYIGRNLFKFDMLLQDEFTDIRVLVDRCARADRGQPFGTTARRVAMAMQKCYWGWHIAILLWILQVKFCRQPQHRTNSCRMLLIPLPIFRGRSVINNGIPM